jgi:hypothetical protein
MTRPPGARWLLAAFVLGAAACTSDRIERGMFHSAKGYRVALPAAGWQPVAAADADLELRRADPPGGMAVSATCEPGGPRRELPLLARHLTFGLAGRRVVERAPARIGGEAAERRVLRGHLDGVEVMVEAQVTRDDRCVYDFLYVTLPEHFEAGRGDFQAVVDSFAIGSDGR